jgi:hypothetical protein
VDVKEPPILKESMDRHRQAGAHPKHRSEQIRAGAQMRNRAKEFRRVALLLQRIVGLRAADQHNLARLQFPFLTRALGGDEAAADADRRPRQALGDGFVSGNRGIDDDLKVFEARPVIYFEEGKRLRVSPGAHPAEDAHIIEGRITGEQAADRHR